MAQQIAQVVIFLLIAFPFAYMAYDVAREVSKQLAKMAESKLIPIKHRQNQGYKKQK